jgi:membrane protein DedA with SNARE-associated domain
MDIWIRQLMETLGYAGITFLMALENIFPPIPSELIAPLAGFTAARGDLSLIGVIIAGTLGSVLGSILLYFLGAWLGAARLEALIGRYGRWLGFRVEDVQRSMTWFSKHGSSAVFWLRLVPGLRSLISIPAGIFKMPIVPFLLLTTLGSSLWTTLLTMAGFFLGENYEAVQHWVDPISKVVLVGFGLATIYWIAKRIIETHRTIERPKR